MEKETHWLRRAVSLLHPFLWGYLFVNGMGGETEVIHDPEQFVVALGVMPVAHIMIKSLRTSFGAGGLDALLEGAAVQDGALQPFPLPFKPKLGIIFSPNDGSFKEEVVLALSVHPGVVASGLGIRWEAGTSL
eukprot:1153398-Pelagomonas_calceolata.AAC.1